MSVLIECASVVILKSAIESKYPGGWAGFVAEAPNRTLCADSYIARIGFMREEDAMTYARFLGQYGLQEADGTPESEHVIVQQGRGALADCPWLELGTLTFSEHDGSVEVARHQSGHDDPLLTPDGWTFEETTAADLRSLELHEAAEQLKFLRREDGINVYWDLQRGKEVFMASRD